MTSTISESIPLTQPRNEYSKVDSESKAVVWKCMKNMNHPGFFLGVLSALCYCLEKITAKDAINHGSDSLLVLTGSKLMNFLLALPILYYHWDHKNVAKNELPYLFGYSIFVTLGTLCMFMAVTFIPVLDVTLLTNTNIIFTIILSYIFLKYKVTWYDTATALIMITGTTFMTKPTFIFGGSEDISLSDQLKGTLLAIGASFGCASFSIFNRKMVRTNVFLISCVSSGVMTVAYAPFMLFFSSIEILSSVHVTVSIVVCGIMVTIGNLLQVQAVKMEEVTNVSFALFFDVPFTFIFQWIFLQCAPKTFELIGMILISFGALTVLCKNKWFPNI